MSEAWEESKAKVVSCEGNVTHGHRGIKIRPGESFRFSNKRLFITLYTWRSNPGCRRLPNNVREMYTVNIDYFNFKNVSVRRRKW